MLFCLFNVVNLMATTPCGCGSMSGGTTMEFTIATPEGIEPDCCKDVAVGKGYIFKWKHQGGGVYVMIESEEVPVGADLQKKGCQNT